MSGFSTTGQPNPLRSARATGSSTPDVNVSQGAIHPLATGPASARMSALLSPHSPPVSIVGLAAVGRLMSP